MPGLLLDRRRRGSRITPSSPLHVDSASSPYSPAPISSQLEPVEAATISCRATLRLVVESLGHEAFARSEPDWLTPRPSPSSAARELPTFLIFIASHKGHLIARGKEQTDQDAPSREAKVVALAWMLGRGV
ncbi:hypothetical protein GQ602_006578 [Ophiocordyceps camponoti-floridani]|uniref:Uncharacterized protein n=1 Tax=Ophiocordyceps camponoti-floridani TaxID=2030778 RepID=A0A8H4VAX9_9HYPO|nr:hypothetical protein GQ602_006578 [Ophiocordyceps camponoti-floridani]